MKTNKKTKSKPGNVAQRTASSDRCAPPCSASSFEEVEWAIEDLLALLFEADMNGAKVYGKRIMDTATWENAITLLEKAELLTGERGKVASRKMQKVMPRVSCRRFGPEDAKKHGPGADELLADSGSLEVKIPHGSLEPVKDYDKGSDSGYVLQRVRFHKVIDALKKPFRCVGKIIHFLQNVIAMATPLAGGSAERGVEVIVTENHD